MLKLGAAAATVAVLAAALFLYPFRSEHSETGQVPQAAGSSSPTVDRSEGTSRSSARPSLPVGKPLNPLAPQTSAGSTSNVPLTGPGTNNPTTADPTTGTPPGTPSSSTSSSSTPAPTSPSSTSTTTTPTQPATTTPSTSTPTPPATTAVPSTTPSSTPSTTPVVYRNCAEVRAAGKAPLYRGDPGYTPALDRNGDGIACENGNS
ncbi:excalibur calcium-binding domain-containing protein [Kribbella sindirgiensis]|uniref:excalibur calcium-binding domain-containing protein n=1 Tax=Kribbella sindirgiensis TaxID=1124744 RepID=UPI001EDED750|nr:excalibur calcium-binding domain-containing protein [Kribbella sindirgiensis]